MDHVIQKSMEELFDYVEQLEEFALLGMMGYNLTHGFNSDLSLLRYQIEDLPEEFDYIKESFNTTIGFTYEMLRSKSSSLSRKVINKDQIERFIELMFKKGGVTLEMQEGSTIYMFKHLFNSVMYELIMNGISYSEDKKVTVYVSETGKVIKVISSGDAPLNPDKIFNLNYSERPGGGTGFGLYACKKLLEKDNIKLTYYRRKSSNENVFIIKL